MKMTGSGYKAVASNSIKDRGSPDSSPSEAADGNAVVALGKTQGYRHKRIQRCMFFCTHTV